MVIVPSVKLDQVTQLRQQLLLRCAERFHQHLTSREGVGFLPAGAVTGEGRAQPLPFLRGTADVSLKDKRQPHRLHPNRQSEFWLAGCCFWLSGGMSAGV